MHQRHQNPAAGGADGVAEGDRAAVDVDPALIPLQYPANRDRLSGKGLIGCDQIDVVQPPAGPLQTATGGMHRGLSHRESDRNQSPCAPYAVS